MKIALFFFVAFSNSIFVEDFWSHMKLCQQGSVEYASLNTEQPELNHNQPQLNHHDLPVPVD